MEELGECVDRRASIEEHFEQKELVYEIRKFVVSLPDIERKIFVCRYWYLESQTDIAKRFGFSESKVNSVLHRIREKLKRHLKQEEF